ncbi:helix-turn-helix protein [Flavobacterium sp. 9]|uniref:helix-turn-helix domain-containing protein n=1 Tax=Flavobacterium sp. 9 TaxID=2035198 RepID=UPI000C19037F|nr:helix-turn-helix domain-containing protein [Flavobacterium sp. 9]PIF30490.1 helix-turn-helix protein [Flavobacterium sp. 9]
MIDLVLSLFFFIAAIIGFATAIMVLFSKNKHAEKFFFGLFLCSLAVVSIYNFYMSANTFKDFPHIFIITKSFIFLAAPSAFLYLRSILFSEMEFKKYEWIHFLPFLIYLSMTILLWTGYNSSNLLMGYIALIGNSPYSLLSVTLWLTYAFCQTIMILHYDTKDIKGNHYYNKEVMNWIRIYNLILLVLFSILFTRHLLLGNGTAADDNLCCILISSVLIFTGIWLYFNPQIFNNQNHNSPAMDGAALTAQLEAVPKDREIKNSFLIDKELKIEKKQEISAKLDIAFSVKKLFLKKDFVIRDLSEETGISTHQLSNFINSEFNLHFQDYINLKRIEYFTEMVNEPKWKDFPLEEMTFASGFKSRTTCFRSFVKHTGKSPSQYLKKIRPNAAKPKKKRYDFGTK